MFLSWTQCNVVVNGRLLQCDCPLREKERLAHIDVRQRGTIKSPLSTHIQKCEHRGMSSMDGIGDVRDEPQRTVWGNRSIIAASALGCTIPNIVVTAVPPASKGTCLMLSGSVQGLLISGRVVAIVLRRRHSVGSGFLETIEPALEKSLCWRDGCRCKLA